MSEFNTVLTTTDFSDAAAGGVATAAGLATALGARLLLLYVVEERLPPMSFSTASQREQIRKDHEKAAARSLEKFAAERLGGGSASVETRLRSGQPAREIIACAEEEGADLIVMATRGYGSVGQMVFGSTAQKVLYGAPCPVVSVRSREE